MGHTPLVNVSSFLLLNNINNIQTYSTCWPTPFNAREEEFFSFFATVYIVDVFSMPFPPSTFKLALLIFLLGCLLFLMASTLPSVSISRVFVFWFVHCVSI